MHSIAKPLLIITAAVFVVYASAVLCLNIYLQSEGVQGRLRGAIAKAAGMPAKVNRTYYTPWSGLALSGIVLPRAEATQKPLLEVQSLEVSISLPALLQGRVVIKNIAILGPTLIAIQHTDGSWADPSSAVVEATPPPPVMAEASSPPLASPEKQPPVAQPAPPEPSEPAPPRVRVESMKIRDGQGAFYFVGDHSTIRFEGLSLEATLPSEGVITGTFRIAKVCLTGSLCPRYCTGTFEWKSGHLRISDLRADWADGRLAGAFELLPAPAPHFSAELTAEDVSLKKISQDAGFAAEGTRGLLFAKATLQGTPGEPASFTGSAVANMTEARLEPIETIRQIGELLRIDELRMLELQTAETSVTIRDGKVVVDQLVLSSKNILMDATGEVGFDGRLALDSKFHVNEKIRRESRGLIGSNFRPSATEGYVHMPFSVTGTLARPNTDLLDKLVGVRIGQDVGGLLKNLFRIPKNQKKKKDTPAASPAH